MASADNLTSKLPDSLLISNLRPSAKHHQSCALLKKIKVPVVIEHLPYQMEIDTCSKFTTVSEYISKLVKVKESCLVNVQYENIHCPLTLIAVNKHCLNRLRQLL
ncbi:hypothetical protein T4B_10063 [Trichinella pseudospiralis]|uniref:Uncharacterized protein n=1 Tax=Trichinella pseudospiralis TaxID=6337 RepID=A0A0V1JXT4_TRIPS|nr:hypothetical protein T4E_7913 [Trichinella pseudospiralis]KRZ18956.1 hypothetical protein T4B_10063 [Trichinella pseudospiralis]KRZ39757.1 hypothetical protein T4C_96 [Trichinella pseudospiralis]